MDKDKNMIASGRVKESLIILVDMDQTIAGFDQRLFEIWKERYPFSPIPDRNSYTYSNKDDYERMMNIASEKGFFRSLPEYEGASEKLNMLKSNPLINVFLCTKPLEKRNPCIVEKYEWIEEHLGKDWLDKVIITNDKTLCMGDILIDDHPKQVGVVQPVWKYIYFNQPYNECLPGPRIMSWSNISIDIIDNEWFIFDISKHI